MAKYWKRIVLAGIAAELLYAVYIYYIAPSKQVAYEPTGYIMVFGLFVLAGIWAGRPIPGLFAAGELVGGLFFHNYPGGSGLTAGLVYGRRAGWSAAQPTR